MEKYELEEQLKEEIRARVFGADFMKIVQSVRRNGKAFKIAIRPVEIGGERRYQAEMTDAGVVQVKNFDANAITGGLEELIAQKGARELHLMTGAGDLHVRVTKKGHVLVSRSAEMNRSVTLKPHDRVKKVPLNAFDSAALLRVIGLTDAEGRVRASMRGKYDQVNEFLKVVKETVGEFKRTSEQANNCFTVVDCGCGKAYLTLALYFYLTEVLKFPEVRVIGVDRRADVIAAAKKMAEGLDVAGKVIFVESDLAAFQPSQPSQQSQITNHKSQISQPFSPYIDLVVSLHACDTATDEAMAKAVEWKARYLLSAPCCQHELQKSLGEKPTDFTGLLRQSILRERLCDILTDAFRALILRILGYRVQVIEFVSSEATARNILLKCESAVKAGQAGPVGEYLMLRDYWKVVPWLETRLRPLLERHLANREER